MLADLPAPAGSDEIVTVADKNAALLKRKQYDAQIKKAVEKLVAKHVDGIDGLDDDGVVASTGCFGGLGSCTPWRRRAVRVSTREIGIAGVSGEAGAPAASSSGSAGKMASAGSRFFGVRKTAASESKKLADAIEMASSKAIELSGRVETGRKKAMELRDAGKKTEALMALKKAKNDEKLLASANAALEALSSQRDMLENAALQRELASALASTTKTIKSKTKGLVKFAEKAVDDTQEMRDDAEDISSVLEGIQPTFNADEDELLEELDAMMQENATPPQPPASVAAAVADSVVAAAAATAAVAVTSFPSAPTTIPADEVVDRRAERRAAKQPLLTGGAVGS